MIQLKELFTCFYVKLTPLVYIKYIKTQRITMYFSNELWPELKTIRLTPISSNYIITPHAHREPKYRKQIWYSPLFVYKRTRGHSYTCTWYAQHIIHMYMYTFNCISCAVCSIMYTYIKKNETMHPSMSYMPSSAQCSVLMLLSIIHPKWIEWDCHVSTIYAHQQRERHNSRKCNIVFVFSTTSVCEQVQIFRFSFDFQ